MSNTPTPGAGDPRQGMLAKLTASGWRHAPKPNCYFRLTNGSLTLTLLFKTVKGCWANLHSGDTEPNVYLVKTGDAWEVIAYATRQFRRFPLNDGSAVIMSGFLTAEGPSVELIAERRGTGFGGTTTRKSLLPRHPCYTQIKAVWEAVNGHPASLELVFGMASRRWPWGNMPDEEDDGSMPPECCDAG